VRYVVTILLCVGIATFAVNAWAQGGPGNDDPSITSSLGIPLSVPLSPTSQHVSFAAGISVAVGYNLNRRNALAGEFMWNGLIPTNATLVPIRADLGTTNVNGHGNVYAFTGNYRFELRGNKLGVYVIGGPGWYYRTVWLSKPVPAGTTISCDRAWLWWGYDCAAGPIVTNSTKVHGDAGALGVSGGLGFTVRVGEAPYRMFAESRYHFAPTGSISTKLLIFSVGIRY
jgi:Outer membrane protein beta-barrel domain